MKKQSSKIKFAAKIITPLVSVLAIIFIVGGCINHIFFGGDYISTPSPITEKDFLSVEKTYLVNRSGEKVQLNGVNLGGWLIQENWMCPIDGKDKQWANLDTINVFEARGFTNEQIQTIFTTYQDNWITEADIKSIAESKMNCIRVPFWYRNFMTGTDGEWISEDFSQNPGFQKLDWVISIAQKYGLYVILDMHGCPGGQSQDHSSGTLNENALYTDDMCINTMKKLWSAIASRYKDNPTVAAYDIMNEPQNNNEENGSNYYDPWQSESWKKTNEIYDIMIKAIRQADPEHIITVEGIWQASNLPDPDAVGWENMMYQVHLYDYTKQFKKNVRNLKLYMLKYGVAGYVGEFNNKDGISVLEGSNINYTLWTYKGVNSEYTSFFNHYASVSSVNPYTDSYEEILAKWSEPIRTENFKE